ncbi:MAG: hypothetical protein WCW29_04980 [Candidatus Paceibacterota bacterium]
MEVTPWTGMLTSARSILKPCPDALGWVSLATGGHHEISIPGTTNRRRTRGRQTSASFQGIGASGPDTQRPTQGACGEGASEGNPMKPGPAERRAFQSASRGVLWKAELSLPGNPGVS